VWHELLDDLVVRAESFYRGDWGSRAKPELSLGAV
jgi:hypothetical protein